MARFHSSLLQGSVQGLDPSILIKPRRLHFTLGVMCLSKTSAGSNVESSSNHTVESALALLRSLQPQVSALCAAGKSGTLRASLEQFGAFESKKGARVLWASPREEQILLPESDEDREERLKLVQVAGASSKHSSSESPVAYS